MLSIWHILLLLLVVVLIFGTGKLRHLGSDLGSAIKSFKKGLAEEDDGAAAERLKADPPPATNSTQAQQHDTHEVK